MATWCWGSFPTSLRRSCSGLQICVFSIAVVRVVNALPLVQPAAGEHWEQQRAGGRVGLELVTLDTASEGWHAGAQRLAAEEHPVFALARRHLARAAGLPRLASVSVHDIQPVPLDSPGLFSPDELPQRHRAGEDIDPDYDDPSASSLPMYRDSGTDAEPNYQAEFWSAILSARKGAPHDRTASAWDGVPLFQAGRLKQVIASAPVPDWYFMSAVLGLLLVMDLCVLQMLPETSRTNAVLLLFWLLVGAAVGGEVWLRMGPQDGLRWFEGYVLEIIFSVDRAFVMFLIFCALETPRRLMCKAMFIGILGSIATRWLFVLGLAPVLERLQIVPYALGLWLVYCGARLLAPVPPPPVDRRGPVLDAGFRAERVEAEGADDVTQSTVVHGLRVLLGPRLGEFYDEEREAVWTVVKDRVVMTLLGAVLLCIFCADVVLALDVGLLKAEQLSNPFLDFTSAVVATFAARALFFVVRDVFNVFNLGRCTLGAVLVFIGAETLFARVVYVNALLSAAVATCIMALAAASSCLAGQSVKMPLPP